MKKKIIIVEDSDLYRLMIAYRLERDGYEVKVFPNGKVAADYMAYHSFDLLITDLQMPVMDGFELIRDVRRYISRTIPIMVISSLCREDEKVKILEMGCNVYVDKPVMAAELSIRIKNLISPNSIN